MLISYNKEKIAQNYNDAFFSKYYNLYNSANHISGLDWNYLIAPYIDRDLHEKLLAVTLKDMQPIINEITGLLSLIRSGYFYTASLILSQLDTKNGVVILPFNSETLPIVPRGLSSIKNSTSYRCSNWLR